MTAKHTPGPWTVMHGRFVYEVSDNRGPIADVSDDYKNYKNNARLIAAAPDLLEALYELVGKIEVMGGCNAHDFEGKSCWPEFERAAAALAKAKGE